MWLIFGFISFALPLLGMYLRGKGKLKELWPFSLGSFLFYALLCIDHLFTIRRRCFSCDFGGIEDTIGAVLLIVGAAAIAVLFVNAIALALSHERE